MTQLPPTPRDVRTAEEYVGQARCLKAWSGYSYRELSRRAAANGDHLPPSTLATALRRSSLPGEQLVAAFVRACGCDPATVDEWTAVRRRIAMAAENGAPDPWPDMVVASSRGAPALGAAEAGSVGAVPSSPVPVPRETALPEPEEAPAEHPPRARGSAPVRRPRLTGLLAVGAVTLICAVGGTPQPARLPVVRHAPGAAAPAPVSVRPPGPLADGWYRIHTVLDGGCLGVAGPVSGPAVRRQRCRRHAGQRFYFEYAGGRTYRIKAGRPGGAPGCLTVDTVSADGNLRLHECAPADPSQLLHIEVVPEERRHHWLPSTLRLRAMADRAGRVLVRATGPDGDDLGFYLTDLERVSGPAERPASRDP